MNSDVGDQPYWVKMRYSRQNIRRRRQDGNGDAPGTPHARPPKFPFTGTPLAVPTFQIWAAESRQHPMPAALLRERELFVALDPAS